MYVTCIKSNGDFTNGREYNIISHKNRGIIAIKNDHFLTHTILNSNPLFRVTKEYFDKYFKIEQSVEKLYSGEIERMGY